jgi:hypothetical protein
VRPRTRILSLLLAASAPALGAQPSDTASVSREPLFTRGDLLWTGVLTAASVVLFQYDEDIYATVQRPSIQENNFLRRTARGVNGVNENTLMLAGLGAYAVGRLSGQRHVADIAFHATEAVAVSTVLNTAVRGALSRARPYVNDGNDAFSFQPFRGFREFEYRAFPSIHGSAAFAAAAVLTSEVHRRWPGATWYVGALSYTAAALPTLSRLYTNRHWASDLVMGSFVGVATGLKLVQYHHTHPGNKIDKLVLGAAQGGAIVVVVSEEF